MSDTDTIRDAIINLKNGESHSFKDAINSVLMNKAMDAIEVQKIGAGQSFFAEPEIEVTPEEDFDLEPEEVADEEV